MHSTPAAIQACFCTIAFQQRKWDAQPKIDRPLPQILPVLAEAGYQAVEIWQPHLGGLQEMELQQIVAELRDLRLAVAMVSPYFDFTSSDESAARSLELARAALQQARRVGSRGVRVFTGRVGSAEATEDQWQRAARCLRELADLSAADGIRWCCETHSRNLMDNVAGARRLMELVDRRNVGLIFQPSTFGAGCMEALEALAPWAMHVHASNSRDGRGCALADGTLDYPAIVQALRRRGFEGCISIEWMGQDAEGMARREGAYLKKLIEL